MSNPKSDQEFNETLKRLMKKDPKPHEEMKKRRSPGANPSRDKKEHDERS
jgi:hypothetical protein